MKRPALLEVHWNDCSMLPNEWQDSDRMKAPTSPMVSVGFRVKEEDGYLFLAASFQADDDWRHFCQPISIPVTAIVKKRRLTT